MFKSTELSNPTNFSNQERRKLRAAGILLAGTALLSACSPGSGSAAPEAPSANPKVSATTETKSPQILAIEKEARAFEQKQALKKAADSYLASGERNTTLE